MNPKVSVIMSVYNGAKFLRSAINSILAQSFNNFEFIIVNDTSTDDTAAILNSYIKDSRLKIITNETNLGLTKSLNKAISQAEGEYIARIDADDISYPDRLKYQVEFLDKNPDFALVGSWTDEINEKGEVVGSVKPPTDSELLKKALIRYNPFVHSSIMIRKSIFERTGLYDESWKYAQDYELYFKIISVSKVANLDESLVASRQNLNSITNKKNRAQTMFALKARVKAIKSGLYPKSNYLYLWRPISGLLLSPSLKRKIKNLFSKA